MMNNMETLIKTTLGLFPETIDISDGELRSENGFFSKSLSDAWHNAENKNGTAENDINFMTWVIYGLLHTKGRENFSKGVYKVELNEISFESIRRAYDKAINESI